jgi:hypothetical protein
LNDVFSRLKRGDKMIKIKSIKPKDQLILEVEFNNGVIKNYDFKKKMEEYPPFKEFLADPSLFKQAKIDAGGVGVSWNEDVDIAEWELWNGGELLKNGEKEVNINFNKNGQGRTGIKVTLPLNWIQSMGITEEKNEAKISFDGKKITLEKII